MSIELSARRSLFSWKPILGAVINRQHPISAQMAACWLFNENHGLRYKDSVAPGVNDLTTSSGTEWNPALYGMGVKTAASCANTSPPNLTNLFGTGTTAAYVTNFPLGATILFWEQSNAGSNTTWNKFTQNVVAGWLITETSSAITLSIRTSNGTTRINPSTSAVSLTAGVWRQFAIVYNGLDWHIAANFQWYINGIAQTTSAASGNPSGTVDLTSDASANFLCTSATPLFDHMIIWNRALSAGEVQQLFYQPFCFMNMPSRFGPTSANVFLNVTATDTLSQSDSVDRSLLLPRAISDSASFSDSAAKLTAIGVAAVDTFAFSDIAGENVILLRSASDSLSESDSVDSNTGIIRTATDSFSESDSAAQNVGLIRSATDSLSFSDVATRLVVLPRTAIDSFSFSDSATATRHIHVTATDTFSFSDLAGRLVVLARIASDTENFSDVATASAIRTKFAAMLLRAPLSIAQANVLHITLVMQAALIALTQSRIKATVRIVPQTIVTRIRVIV